MDTTTDEAPTTFGSRVPSSDYDGVLDASEVGPRFKALWAAAIAEHAGGNPYGMPRDITRRLHEDMRLAYVRAGSGAATHSATPRVRIQSVATPNPDDDGATITCAGPCGERQSIRKYPTLKGGGRGTVCRACAATMSKTKQ
jgi:hypothetical protein